MRTSILSAAVRLALLAGTAFGAQAAFAGGYVTVSSSGDHVLTRCNPRNLSYQDRCRVDSLPGLPGYTQKASRSVAIVVNDVTIGTLYDRVWTDTQGNTIFGMRIQLNANAFDLTGEAYNVNDLFRQMLANQPGAIAYQMGPSTKALKKAGRTVQGLNEPPPDEAEEGTDEVNAAADNTGNAQPTRNNGWIDFRIDANAAELSGPSSASSPWLLLKTKAPAGYSVKPFAVRALSSDYDDLSRTRELFLSGYQPN